MLYGSRVKITFSKYYTANGSDPNSFCGFWLSVKGYPEKQVVLPRVGILQFYSLKAKNMLLYESVFQPLSG